MTQHEGPKATDTPVEAAAEQPPPLLGRWRNVYFVVIAELALLVALFYALGRWAT